MNTTHELAVEIVEMPPMRVASTLGFGASPEAQAIENMVAFAKSRGIDYAETRHFGFDNPSPSPGSPNYGYEVWMVVGPDVRGNDDVVIKQIPARRYAMTTFKGLENIGQVWKQLVLWLEESPYEWPAHSAECLEELLTPMQTPLEEYVFNLYLPIAG
jgi:effector-binding domain-containing protein